MKKIIGILAALMMCFTLSSCVTPAQAQIDGVYDGVSVDVVIGYGTPIYNAEGLLMYYIYRDLYYYPYIYNNRYYFHRYYRPLPPDRYRPVPRDFYRHYQPHHGHGGHYAPHHGHGGHYAPHHGHGGHYAPHHHGSPNRHSSMNHGGGTYRPHSGGHMTPRSSTRVTQGHHGGGSHARMGGRR